MNAQLLRGDCLERLKELPDNSVDSVVTDPPYGLSFMGKKWDYDVPSEDIWRECLRVLKPGGHLLAFAGTRTQHRMAVRIEDAGFEIRDMIAWVYGSGFPKSADVSKHLDAYERKTWLDVCKALDNADQSAILAAWKEYSKTASSAGLSFRKSETATGTNTQRSDSVPASVLLQANPESSDAAALVAELSLSEARLISEASCSFVQSLAGNNTTELRSPATNAGSQPASHEATLSILDSSALQSAWGWQGENTADKLKAVEALNTWLGRKKSSSKADTAALCAALTADLKRIILSRSETYRNADMTQQTAFASAISVTITESTAESLISFTVDTLRNKAIDKAAGAEREVVGPSPYHSPGRKSYAQTQDISFVTPANKKGDDGKYITAPATDSARQWHGWGTALKPALEPITVARKPLVGTVAANVLEHGTGALNIDGCRVAHGDDVDLSAVQRQQAEGTGIAVGKGFVGSIRGKEIPMYKPGGRWPANLIHDGSEEVVGLFPVTTSGKPSGTRNANSNMFASGGKGVELTGFGDSGSAARFFYCSKASKRDRNEGLPEGATSNHPTVKPTALMRYLCRLVTPPGGTVLDPFMGSGSTGKAAMLEGFQFIGIEREAEYLEIAKARIEDAAKSVDPQLDIPGMV